MAKRLPTRHGGRRQPGDGSNDRRGARRSRVRSGGRLLGTRGHRSAGDGTLRCVGDRPADARRRRSGDSRGLAEPRSRASGDRHDRLQRDRHGGGVDPQGAYHYLTKPFKQDELAIFLERALDEAARCGERHRALQARAADALSRPRRFIGHSAGHAGGARAHRARGRRAGAGDRAGRDRDRQGARRPRPPRGQPARGPAVRLGQLRGAAGGVARERAVRLRQGRLHRRRPPIAPGCSSRPTAASLFLDEIGEMPPGAAGEAAPRAGERDACGRSARRRRRSVDVRIIAATHRNLGRGVPRGDVPGGPALSARRRLDRDAAACAIAARTSPSCSSTSCAEARAASTRDAVVRRSVTRGAGAAARYAGRGTSASSAHMVERLVLLGRAPRSCHQDLRRPGQSRRRSAAASLRFSRRDQAGARAGAAATPPGRWRRPAGTGAGPPRSWASIRRRCASGWGTPNARATNRERLTGLRPGGSEALPEPFDRTAVASRKCLVHLDAGREHLRPP